MKSNIPKKPVTPAAKDNIKAIKKEPKEIYVKQERKGESPGSLFTYCKLVMN